MPKWICEKCGHEFWGWVVFYKYRKGNTHRCPDCNGRLLQKMDDPMGKTLAEEYSEGKRARVA